MPRGDESKVANQYNATLILMPITLYKVLRLSISITLGTNYSALDSRCSTGSDAHEAGRLSSFNTLPLADNDYPRSSARSAMDTSLRSLDLRYS